MSVVPMKAGRPCKSCGSVDQSKFSGEMGIHFPGLNNIDKLVAWVFPKLVGPDAELRLLAKGNAAAAG